jgi:hypothetical protein
MILRAVSYLYDEGIGLTILAVRFVYMPTLFATPKVRLEPSAGDNGMAV